MHIVSSDQNKFSTTVWIDEQKKIVSFHYVEDYHKHTYHKQESFMEFLRTLQQRGFRFQ